MTSTMKNVGATTVSANAASTLVPIAATVGVAGGTPAATAVRITIINSDTANILIWGIATSSGGRTVLPSSVDNVVLMLQPGDDVFWNKVGSNVVSAYAEAIIV